MKLASIALLSGFPVYGQYICTVLLIVVCMALAANISVAVHRKHGEGRASFDAQTDGAEGSGPSEDVQAERVAATAADEFAATSDGQPAELLPAAENQPPPFSALRSPRIVYGNYDRSFLSRLILADDKTKGYYVGLANQMLGYKKVRCRIAWACASFVCGRRILAKIAIKGKTLCVYLPLDPAEYVNSKYSAADVSGVKKYEKVPTRLKVRSERGMKYAKQLIERAAGEMSLVRGGKGSLTAADFPYEQFDSLFARGLIKLRTKGGVSFESGDTLAWAGFERRERVSAVEVTGIALPETAMQLKSVRSGYARTPRSGKKCIINIDTLSANFTAGDRADLSAMKQKGLVHKNAVAVKVLARGVLDKPLTVIADGYSADAVKMILLTGGKALLS